MDPRREQILHWICTEEHIIKTDYVKPCVEGTALIDDPVVDDAPSSTASSSTAPPDTLTGAADDPLIPTTAEIERVFHDGRATWTRLVKAAKALPLHVLPVGCADPSIMLQDVPALPARLPRKGGFLTGRPLWHVPDPEADCARDEKPDLASDHLDFQYSHGVCKHFRLSFSKPVACSVHAAQPPSPDDGLQASQKGLAILTMCWSYILSARLLELQGRKVVYTQHFLPTATSTLQDTASDIILKLPASTSPALVRWLAALLSPTPGWSGDGNRPDFSPWAAFCSGPLRFGIVVSQASSPPDEQPPSPPTSAQATDLLIELCTIYDFLDGLPSELTPATAAFLAALALPFARDDDHNPRFPSPGSMVPTTSPSPSSPPTKSSRIRQYTADLRYYMTLSMHPRSLGSVLWSIFWQPSVPPNLVSPWLASISTVLTSTPNPTQLAQVFLLRRPRVALWWVGLLLLGDLPTIHSRITCYLSTTEERWGFGSLARPDIAAAAWTGAPQSFLDEPSQNPYGAGNIDQQIARCDLLRHRYNFRLQDETSLPVSWTPFGSIPRKFVEPDLWPWLDRGHVREYIHWVWWIKHGRANTNTNTNISLHYDVQLGFRRDTGRFVANVPDYLDITRARGRRARHGSIKIEPSRASTVRMVSHCMQDITGDIDTAILALPGADDHPWLKDWIETTRE
ncbi:hypothetical protein C8A05DRAFT_14821 [Staphylotrichum tortipilum]|uniref:Uncharacterized protein n=1 Tax=Staphylotrichum tortipilum TaxID=2831512 RepID=A0AAN6MM75_9PEZI|nr:hypothetical protein C8A05DRAFT_14821 [Staphylotrichum longicolle]